MNSRALAVAFFSIPLLTAGCSTFSRSNPDAENAAGKDGKNVYSARESAGAPSENVAPSDLKDQKIQHLETTVTSLNTRIQELEGKLEAARLRPDYSAGDTSSQKNTERQAFDALNRAGRESKIQASVAANDPGAGFVNDASVRAFQQARLLFDLEKFPESILAFSAFLEGNPGHPLASAAQYYIGENYYRQGDYAVADQEFQKLASRYPQSPRLSYALVRLSQSTAALGKAEESRRYRVQVEGLFPKSPALKLFRESPAAPAAEAASATAAPIATAPAIAIEKPTVPPVIPPTVEAPTIEKAVAQKDLDIPAAEFPADGTAKPAGNAPRARISGAKDGDTLDAPPGGGG